jgi:DNA gyrase/topoisomerase IV subunit A
MGARDELRELKAAREKTGRALDEKLTERGKLREQIHAKQKREPADEQRERELEREIEALQDEERDLTHRITALRERNEELRDKIAEEKRDLADQRQEVVVQAGAPHWGGCEDILASEVVPVAAAAGVASTSGKRSETFGNPDSDHHTSQTTASARDFATANNYGLRDQIMRALGVTGAISDYGAYYIERAGRTFRVQPIAGTHGTGPHLHIGIRLV